MTTCLIRDSHRLPSYNPLPTCLPTIEAEETYFDRLALFGIACLAAALVGKLVIAAARLEHREPVCDVLRC